MIYRPLGTTGLNVSRIGFGGIPVQRISRGDAVRLIRAAFDEGINFFDTSRVYTDSEVKMGEAFEGIRDRVVIATKSYNRSADGIYKDIGVSLKKLRTDWIDLYQLHNVSSPEIMEKIFDEKKGALKGLIRAKENGLIRHIGITSHKLKILESALAKYPFETVQFPFNFIEREAENFIKACAGRNVATIIMKPLAGGSLIPASSALSYVLSHDITCAIPGMQSQKELVENVNGFETVSDKDREKLEKLADNLDKHFCRRCEYCLSGCPEGINITAVLLLHLYYKNYGLRDWAIKRYASLKPDASVCRNCGLCEKACPYELSICEMLNEAHHDLSRFS